MITFISGRVHSVRADSLTVVTAGLGRRVHVTPQLAADTRHGAEIDLHTVLVVREDSLTLYGFAGEDERDLFETLQTISGIGPRLALAVLSVLSPDELRAAIASGDQVPLTKVPGVGKKVAARLMLELAGNIDTSVARPAPGRAPAAPPAVAAQVVDALVGLGWRQAQAESAVEDTAAGLNDPTVSELLKAALRALGART
ncbi:Holliday junction branch migration protein RuvA [Brevibacterium sp. CS2]|uniref:Holliday junction branch migration protein RuvA n=1 Tax=Brevibacterium sp. CS2 TaxID=2575923 RepID=UPI0010C773D1|nr:Holliday junction branch migration protein RuvA [Brevibacterium sp. CS2]QCP05911.1 Holliday junction branch migration protein RuvA [Brevibacterium sp. CS2]